MSDKIDFRDFKPVDEKKKKETPKLEAPGQTERWWTASEKDLPGAVAAQVSAILKNDRTRLNDYNIFTRLYGNIPAQQWMSGAAAGKGNSQTASVAQYNRIAFNLVKACTDALTSKMAKSKPAPYFLTSKGNSKLQRKAKKLNDFTNGLFYQNQAYVKGRAAFRDACVWGMGIIHVYSAHGRVYWERVMPYEIFVDYLEAHSGADDTKTMHRMKNVDRATLIAMYPDKADEIGSLSLVSDVIGTSTKSVADTVNVVESWRLPSGPDADDGVHCITSQGITLFVERWERTTFPFAVIRYSEDLYGYWAQGLAAELMPIQVELNRCLMSIQRSLQLGGTFKILVHAGSKIVDSHFDNRIGTIIKWAGEVAPSYITPPLVQSEIYQQVNSLKSMGFEQSGISQLSAAAQKPAGLDSGEALRAFNDIETDRFQKTGQDYEQFYLDLARLSIEEARSIYAETGKLSVTVPGKRFIQTVDWKDVDMENDQYYLQCFPMSKLPTDPEGRLATIQELMQGGLISQENGQRLLDFPDLAEDQNLSNAQLDYLHEILDTIVDGGEYTPPEPDDNLQAALKLGVEYLAVGKRDYLEPGRISQLRQFISDVNALVTQSQPPPMPTAGPAPAAPAPPPVSQLIPNVNQ
jgi:hypothetical protein